MKSKNLIRNVLVTVAIVLMSTVLCGAGCTNVADSGSNGGSGGSSNGVAPELKATPQVGSIIMKDGSLKTVSDITEADKANAIAVVYKVWGGRAWAVGKVHEKNSLERAKSGIGHLNKISALVTTVTRRGGINFYGYTDGSKGQEELKKVATDYGDGKNYPAWAWVEKYGTTNCSRTPFESGWYFPSVAELFDIWSANSTSSSAVETALDKSGGDKFGESEYWSSSQHDNGDVNALVLFFKDGDDNLHSKAMSNSGIHVCAVRAFTYQRKNPADLS